MRKLPISSAHFSLAFKITAGILSVLAALATIIPAARQSGILGPMPLLASNVARIRLAPNSDTAWALGDTLAFAATATDTNGATIPAPRLTWTVTNTEVAESHPDGSVIATGACAAS
ncbi:MAG: hypothetical protein JF590_05195 [Gemmatimonadetes bacterium]|nr:hypothetical protein [Gemmatimonadota bacterium]